MAVSAGEEDEFESFESFLEFTETGGVKRHKKHKHKKHKKKKVMHESEGVIIDGTRVRKKTFKVRVAGENEKL